jgi:hypothetical protein
MLAAGAHHHFLWGKTQTSLSLVLLCCATMLSTQLKYFNSSQLRETQFEATGF